MFQLVTDNSVSQITNHISSLSNAALIVFSPAYIYSHIHLKFHIPWSFIKKQCSKFCYGILNPHRPLGISGCGTRSVVPQLVSEQQHIQKYGTFPSFLFVYVSYFLLSEGSALQRLQVPSHRHKHQHESVFYQCPKCSSVGTGKVAAGSQYLITLLLLMIKKD